MSVKSVTMDPKLLSIGGNRGKTSRNSKKTNTNTRKMSKVKQELIKRLKSHETNSKSKNIDNNQEIKQVISGEQDLHFLDSMNHLNDVIKNAKNKKQTKKKKKDPNSKVQHIVTPTASILTLETETFDEKVNKNSKPWFSLLPEPSYGNLKNGSKPTYREFSKTKSNRKKLMFDNKCETAHIPEIDTKMEFYNAVENTPSVVIKTLSPIVKTPDSIDLNPEVPIPAKVEPIQDVVLDKAIDTHIESKLELHVPKVQNKLRKKTIRVGRTGNSVSFLCKNNKTRKKVKTIEIEAHQEKISKIKRELLKKRLIKPTCDAPDSILRDMYKTLCVTGLDVCNKQQPTRIEDILE